MVAFNLRLFATRARHVMERVAISRSASDNPVTQRKMMSSAVGKNFGLPVFTSGPVVKGFGRGSKELGVPTANFPEAVVDKLPKEVPCGIYFGWASVDNGPIHKMVMSIGWNPFYKNIKKSMETHIIYKFDHDFYDSELKIVILGYLRPEATFSSLDELVSAIQKDISDASAALEQPEFLAVQNHIFFHSTANGNKTSHSL